MTGFCSSNSIGIIFLNGLNEFIFVNSYGIIVITVIINHFGNIYITVAVSLCGSNGVSIICLNSFNKLIFINSYGIIVVTVIINHFGNIYITLAIILCGSNSVGVILLNKIAQLLAVDINLISMITFYAFICNFQHIGCGLYGSNSISINNILQLIGYPAAGSNAFYLCLHAVLVGILNLYRQLAVFIQASFHAGIGSISVNGIFLNGLHELIFIEAYSIIIVTVIIHTTVNSYIILTIILCSSNGVGVILLNKIAQLVAVDINLIRMIAIGAFIGDFQHIGFCFYGSNSISPGNAFQLIGYPAAGSNAFYLCLHAVLVGILNLYRQLAIFIQASFHAGISGISINNTLHLLVYPALGSNAIYTVSIDSAGIISNLGSQRAVCKGQFIGCNLGIGINNGCSKYLIISSYQLIGIDCLALTGSCSNRFNNCILQACLACFTVNGLCHGNIICIERFNNSVKFAYGNIAHRLFALHFGIITCMYRSVTIAFRIPLIIISMINKRCEQFNLLAGADLYLRMSQVSPEIFSVPSVSTIGSIINLSCSVFGNSLVNRRRGRRVGPNSSITHHAHCHDCRQYAL